MVNPAAARQVLFERRLLFFVTGLLGLGFVVWLVSISTDYWCIVDGKNGIFVPKTKRYFLQSITGIWRTCRTSFTNKTKALSLTDKCVYIDFFPSQPGYDKTFVDYRRSLAAFSIITAAVMMMGMSASIYTFRQTRYMYKRLAAGLHAVAAGCVLIVIEVYVAATDYAKDNIPFRHPPGSEWHFGYSYMLAWVTFATNLIGAVVFAYCSRKRKKDKAPNDRFAIDEGPTIIGR